MNHNRQTPFEDIFFSGPLLDVELFQIHHSYFEIPGNHHWILDAGIQLTFAAGSLTFSWVTQEEMFQLNLGKFEDHLGQSEYKTLKKENIAKLNSLVGQTVKDADWIWAAIQIFDPEKEEFLEDQALLELFLSFSSGDTLQMAPITYQLTPEDDPINYSRHLDQEILIAINHRFEL